MKVKYNRTSTLAQTGARYSLDTDTYDLTLFDRISGSIKFTDRPEAKKLIQLVNNNQVTQLVIEELSRLGRSTSDCLNTLEWLDEHNVNVTIRNIGLQSRPNGIVNPIWSIVSAVMSSMYQLELSAIRERTQTGIQVYLQNGGRLGRPGGSNENTHQFLNKPKNKQIRTYLEDTSRHLTIREIVKLTSSSIATVMKVKTLITQP